MTIVLTLESPKPPSVVLASIRRLGGEWRESKIRPDLRSDRVLAIEGWVEGSRFRFGYMRRWYWRGEGELRVRGEVLPDARGGSVISVRCGSDPWPATLFAIPIAGVAMWMFRGDWMAWVFCAFTAVQVAMIWKGEAGITRENPQADYLVARIEAAVAAARSGTAEAQPRTG